MTSFTNWKEAHKEAIKLARQLNKEVGVYKTKEFNLTVYQVLNLPKPENRQVFELRCEVVGPSDPF